MPGSERDRIAEATRPSLAPVKDHLRQRTVVINPYGRRHTGIGATAVRIFYELKAAAFGRAGAAARGRKRPCSPTPNPRPARRRSARRDRRRTQTVDVATPETAVKGKHPLLAQLAPCGLPLTASAALR
jgi:hypothetical protein